jgi:hypothetical protein
MKKVAFVLLVVGLLQMTGDLSRLPLLKGIGAAMGASPAPKVFTAARGIEAYSTRFFLEWTDSLGVTRELQLTPEIYQRLAGLYNRRNAYGATLSGGPVMATEERLIEMYRSVSEYALCGQASLLRELGIDPAKVVGAVRVRYERLPGTTMGDLPRVLEAPCK